MLIIYLTEKGYSVSSPQKISTRLFEQVGNTVVEVVCTPPSKKSISTIANEVCEFMTTFMPTGMEVRTSQVVLQQSTYSDLNGTYVNSFHFQVYI